MSLYDDAREMWDNNFYNAKKFFESKGNITTKGKFKIKWYNKFYDDLNKLGEKLIKEAGT